MSFDRRKSDIIFGRTKDMLRERESSRRTREKYWCFNRCNCTTDELRKLIVKWAFRHNINNCVSAQSAKNLLEFRLSARLCSQFFFIFYYNSGSLKPILSKKKNILKYQSNRKKNQAAMSVAQKKNWDRVTTAWVYFNVEIQSFYNFHFTSPEILCEFAGNTERESSTSRR